MTRTDLVSVVIPTYNRAKLVQRAIDSVLSQTYSNMEVIVVDDGSTDDTLRELRSYDGRIRVLSQPNGGPAAARNLGIAHACGELIAFLDSDDIWVEEKVERQVRLLESVGKAVPCCITNIEMRWNDGIKTSFDISWLHTDLDEGLWLNVARVLASRFVLFNQSVLVRRTALEKTGYFNENLRLLEDRDLALRLSLQGPWAFIKEPLVIWCDTPGSCSKEAMVAPDIEIQAKLRLLEAAVKWVSSQNGRHVQRDFASELKRTRRELKAAELRAMSSPALSAAGRLLQFVEKASMFAFRRSPWFPAMKVRKIEKIEVSL